MAAVHSKKEGFMNANTILPAELGEKMQYLAHTHNDNTIRFVLHYPGAVRAEVLRAAAEAVCMSVPMLHASFVPQGDEPHWLVHESLTPEDYFTRLQAEGDPMPAAVAAAARPVAPQSRAQLRCTLVEGDGACAVTLTISHMCVDGGDGKYLLSKLVEAYDRILTTGSADGLTVKNGSRSMEQVLALRTAEDLKALETVPPSHGIRSGFRFPTEEAGTPRITYRHISAETMAAARKRAKAQGSTANDLLLTAFYRVYASLEDVDAQGPMAIMSMMDLRPHCKGGDTAGLCNLSGSLPTCLPQGVQGDFDDTMAQITAQTRKVKEDPLAGLYGMPGMLKMIQSIPLSVLEEQMGKMYVGSMGLGLTNLGNFSCAALSLGGLAPDRGLVGGPLKKKPSMQITASSFDGCATLAVAGQYTDADKAYLDAVLQSIALEIETYAGI